MKNLFYFILLIFSCFVFSLLIKEDGHNIKFVKIAGENIKVDLAESAGAQARGLGGRLSLLSNEGMLFVFQKSGIYSFWMKGMNFPIDIVWIDEDLRVVYIKENALPSSYPESFSPGQNSKYVLEVSALFSEKHNLKIGDGVEFVK